MRLVVGRCFDLEVPLNCCGLDIARSVLQASACLGGNVTHPGRTAGLDIDWNYDLDYCFLTGDRIDRGCLFSWVRSQIYPLALALSWLLFVFECGSLLRKRLTRNANLGNSFNCASCSRSRGIYWYGNDLKIRGQICCRFPEHSWLLIHFLLRKVALDVYRIM